MNTNQSRFKSLIKILTITIALLCWFAVITQYDLMIKNSTESTFETSIRFFSFFTITTNSLVALYFLYLSYHQLKNKETTTKHFGCLTALTVYITIVGLVYQLVLSQTWNPEGTQKIVDELLHFANPILVVVYWFLHRKKNTLNYYQIPYWLIYPLIYLIYVLIRGSYSNFYPYPFFNISEIGLGKVAVNSLVLTIVFIFVSLLFVWIARRKANQ